jgi:hypothetical protein
MSDFDEQLVMAVAGPRGKPLGFFNARFLSRDRVVEETALFA